MDELTEIAVPSIADIQLQHGAEIGAENGKEEEVSEESQIWHPRDSLVSRFKLGPNTTC